MVWQDEQSPRHRGSHTMQKSQTSSVSSQGGSTGRAVEIVHKKEVKVERPRRSMAANSDLSRRSTNQAARSDATSMRQKEQRGRKPKESRSELFPALKPRISDYLSLLAKPFTTETVRCPINFNPMPTPFSMTARSNWLYKGIVAAGANLQVVIFPGHTAPVDADEMDGPSYHSNWQLIGNPSVTVPVGPISYADAGAVQRAGCLGVISTYSNGTVSTGSVILDTSTNVSLPIYPDTYLPITGMAKNSSHTRYKMLASGIKFCNETTESTRGGTFYSVQPVLAGLPLGVSGAAGGAIKDWTKYPTFFDHGLCDEKQGVVSWIPRTQDIAFWHPGVSTSYTIGISNAAYILWYVNTTGSNQTISISSTHHWEIGGENVQTLCDPTSQVPADQNVIVPTLTTLQDTSHTAAPAPRVAEVVNTVSAPVAGRGKVFEDWGELGSKLIRDHIGPAVSAAVVAKLHKMM